MLEILEIKK